MSIKAVCKTKKIAAIVTIIFSILLFISSTLIWVYHLFLGDQTFFILLAEAIVLIGWGVIVYTLFIYIKKTSCL